MQINFNVLAEKIVAETLTNLNNLKRTHWYLPKFVIASIYTAAYQHGAESTGAMYEDIIKECVWDEGDISRINEVNEVLVLETMLLKSK